MSEYILKKVKILFILGFISSLVSTIIYYSKASGSMYNVRYNDNNIWTTSSNFANVTPSTQRDEIQKFQIYITNTIVCAFFTLITLLVLLALK